MKRSPGLRVYLICALLVIMSVSSSYSAEKTRLYIPLWPHPQRMVLREGQFEVQGKHLFIPENPGEKTLAVACVVSHRLSRYFGLSTDLKIKIEGACPAGYFALALCEEPPDWSAVARKFEPKAIPSTGLGEAYVLQIDSKLVMLAAPTPRGLANGALTLMQMARCATQGTTIPGAWILDWPDLEVRAAHSRGVLIPVLKKAALWAADTKLNMLVWETNVSAFPFRSHPEVGRQVSDLREIEERQSAYKELVDLVRGGGVEAVPLHNMSNGHWRKSGGPYPFLGDGETYFWAMTEIIDEELEIFRPRYFHLGLDEEHFTGERLNYPTRTLPQWRDVIARFTEHLRRRGVASMGWTDPLYGGRRKWYGWPFGKEFPEGYDEFTATFPGDFIFVPWFYWTKTPEDTIDGPGRLRQQAETGHGVITAARGDHVQCHTNAVMMLKGRYPNILGVLATCWSGERKHVLYVRREGGQFWNVGCPGIKRRDPSTDEVRWIFEPEGFVLATEEDITGWDVLLDADLSQPVSENLKKLADPAWRMWLEAREELVAAGLPAVPELLAAMSKAKGEYRQRIEGCISRNARDARHGRRRGRLDVPAVLAFLDDPGADVRALAAEVIVSCSEKGLDVLRQGVRNPRRSAACIRALGIVKSVGIATELIGVLNDKTMSVEARAEAAKVLGLLRAKDAAPALLQALRAGRDASIEKASLWSLALLGCKKADRDIAQLLDSPDQDKRWRAALALVLLDSLEVRRLATWLSGKDRHSLELAAWALWRTTEPQEASNVFSQAAASQRDKISRQRLEQLSQVVVGKGNPRARF